MKQCPKCNTTHTKEGKFCSRSCANSRQFSEETKLKKSNSAKNSDKVLNENASRRVLKIEKECTICNSKFYTLPCKSQIKTCSKECKSRQVSLSCKGKVGGYREGSGRAKTGYYKNIYCGSTYELVWIIYRLDHNLPVNKFQGFIIYNDNKKYFPDFIIDNTIVEIKGYHTTQVNQKTEAAIEAGYEIKVLYKENLKTEFDWVKNNYQYKNIEELYDDYKPKYVFTCNQCNIEFTSEKQKKTENTYCSRVCAGKYQAFKKHNS